MYSRFTWIGFKPIRNGKLTSKEYYVKNGEAVGHSEWKFFKDGKEYIANLKTKEYIEARTIVRKDHITLTYSKADVKKKYQATVGTTFDEKNSYKTKPSYKSPYKAGALSDAVIKQTLTNLNYARWQVGLNSVKTYDKYMERSQKGAVIMAANNMLTHYPSKPSGMSDEFYKEACAGVGADVTYSGNVSWGESLPRSVFGYLSDANNMQALVHFT